MRFFGLCLVFLAPCSVWSYRWSERTTVRSQRTEEESHLPKIKFSSSNGNDAQVSRSFHSTNPELAQIPWDIVQCYVNGTLWDKVSNRVPFSINTFAHIIRKLENHPRARAWSAGQLAANIIHKGSAQYSRLILNMYICPTTLHAGTKP